MKTKIISMLILILLYTIAIKDTITLYYVSGPVFSSFVSNIPHNIIIPIVLVESFFSIIFLLPTIMVIKDLNKENPPTKPEFNVIIISLVFFPISTWINNYISGFYQYSVVVLILGFLFAVIWARLYLTGIEREPESKIIIENEKIMDGIYSIIQEYEFFRCPVKTGLTAYPISMQLKFGKQMERQAFLKKYSGEYKKIKSNLDPFFKNAIYSKLYNPSPNEYLLRYDTRFNLNINRRGNYNLDMGIYNTEMNAWFSIMSCGILSLILVSIFFKLINSGDEIYISEQILIPLFLISFFSLYSGYVYLSTKNRRIWAKKCDDALKNSIQKMIDCGAAHIQNNDMDPKNFPLKLRHDDYLGLVYEKKGENNFLGYFKK